ncbi:MAG: SET domain-containing protein [Aggregatilineales bacterium]
MLDLPSSYLSPKLEVRDTGAKGRGVFALQPIRAGELVAAWGGTVVPAAALNCVSGDLMLLGVQIEEGLYLVSDRSGPGDYINHSCNPNAGIAGSHLLVAMRDIAPGEEVCFDYAMTDSSPYDEFECACGAPNCRGRVTGSDWRLPELWQRYDGYFSLYLQRRINQLKRV